MATKKVTYKEPASYFNAAMKKAAEDWDKEQAGKAKAKAETGKKPAAGKKPKTEPKKK